MTARLSLLRRRGQRAVSTGFMLSGVFGCGSGSGRGSMQSMSATLIDPVEALAPFGDSEMIPLPEFGEPLGLNRGRRNYAVQKGIIRTVPGPGAAGRGRGGCHMISRDEALLILASVALAAVIGVTVATMIRTLRDSGASFTADGVFVPLKGLSIK